MRVNIKNTMKLINVAEYQIKKLEECSVQYISDNDKLIIQVQKIDLEEQDMEDILEVIYQQGEFNIVLERYDFGRYSLKID